MRSFIGILVIVIAGFSLPALAAEPTLTPKTPELYDEQWHFEFGIPFWLTSINGDLQTPRFNDIPVNASFSHVIDHFTFGVMAHAEARKEHLGFGTDLFYVNLSDALDVDRAPPELKNQNLGMKQVFAELFSYYRFLLEGNPKNPQVFDLLGGARYYWTQSEIDQSKSSLGWVDLMLGMRGQIAFGDHLGVRLRSDFAFLGSKFTWNLIGEGAWTFSEHWAVTAGYRAMDIDYENNSTQKTWDLNYHGPMIGVYFSW